MSERKAKQQNKVLQGNQTKAKTSSPKGIYVVMVVIIGLVLGLGIKTIKDESARRNPKTVEQYAKYIEGISTEEFLAKYGLDSKSEINGDTDIATAVNAMPIAKYAEINGIDFEELKSYYNYSETMPEYVTFEESMNYKRLVVSDYARDDGITTEEFLAKWGLSEKTEITGDTDIATAIDAMPIEKYAEYNGTTVTALGEEYGFVTDERLPITTVTLSEAQYYVTMEKAAELSGKDYETFLAEDCYGLTEADLPRDMLMVDAMPEIDKAYEALVAENEAAAAAEAEAEANTGTETEATAEANTETEIEATAETNTETETETTDTETATDE